MIGRFARIYWPAINLVGMLHVELRVVIEENWDAVADNATVRMVKWIEMHVGRIFHQAKLYNSFKILHLAEIVLFAS